MIWLVLCGAKKPRENNSLHKPTAAGNEKMPLARKCRYVSFIHRTHPPNGEGGGGGEDEGRREKGEGQEKPIISRDSKSGREKERVLKFDNGTGNKRESI